MDFTREGYAPLDKALAAWVLQVAGWLAHMDEAEGDPKIALNWLEDLVATVNTVDARGQSRFRALADELAAEADSDPIWGGGDFYRRMASLLLGETRLPDASRDTPER